MYTDSIADLDEVYALTTDDEDLRDVQPYEGLSVRTEEQSTCILY